MISSTGIIKKSQVKSAGRRRLGSAGAGQGGAATIETHLVSSDESRAVIEIVCKCGERIEIVCEYATAPDQGPAAADAAAVQEYGETQE